MNVMRFIISVEPCSSTNLGIKNNLPHWSYLHPPVPDTIGCNIVADDRPWGWTWYWIDYFVIYILSVACCLPELPLLVRPCFKKVFHGLILCPRSAFDHSPLSRLQDHNLYSQKDVCTVYTLVVHITHSKKGIRAWWCDDICPDLSISL